MSDVYVFIELRRRRDRRRAGRVDRLDAARPAGLRASSSSSARRFPRFHIGESLIPETYWVLKRLNMLPKMQQSHFVKKYSVQFVNASGQAVGAVLLLGQQAARVLADLAGGAQRVRPDDARQRPRARRRGARRRAACSTCSSRASGPSASAFKTRTAHGETCAPRSSSTPAARAACCRTGSSCALWDPDAEQGRDLDLLGRRLSRHRPRRRRDDGPADRQQEGLVLVHPAARRHRQRRRRGAVRLPVQGPRRATSRSINEEVERCPAVQGAGRRRPTRVTGYFATQGLLVPREAGGRRRLGAGRRRLRLSRSALFVGRAAGAASRASWRPTPSSKGSRRATRRRAQLGKWGAGVQRGRGPHAAAGVRVLRRLQLRRRSSGSIPSCGAR